MLFLFLGDVFAYEIFGRPGSALEAWERNESVGGSSTEVDQEDTRMDSVGGASMEIDEEGTVTDEDTGISPEEGECFETTRSTASTRTGPNAASERSASPPWNFEQVEESLVIDENGNKRSTRANRPKPGSFKL